MNYSIVIQKLADSQFKKLKKSGDSVSLKKLKHILVELETHPRTGLGNPEELKYDLSGFWSRRLNKKDRLVYQIIEEPDRMIVIVSA